MGSYLALLEMVNVHVTYDQVMSAECLELDTKNEVIVSD